MGQSLTPSGFLRCVVPSSPTWCGCVLYQLCVSCSPGKVNTDLCPRSGCYWHHRGQAGVAWPETFIIATTCLLPPPNREFACHQWYLPPVPACLPPMVSAGLLSVHHGPRTKQMILLNSCTQLEERATGSLEWKSGGSRISVCFVYCCISQGLARCRPSVNICWLNDLRGIYLSWSPHSVPDTVKSPQCFISFNPHYIPQEVVCISQDGLGYAAVTNNPLDPRSLK